MHESFVKKIKELYDLILQPVDNMYKIITINNYKTMLNIKVKNKLSEEYFRFNGLNKEKGIVYTPEEISLFIIKEALKPQDIINNPNIKVLDPACGCGNLIIPCFEYLKEIFSENLNLINEKNCINLKEEDITKHIIDNNLYGFDIDEDALTVLLLDLFTISGYINTQNFKKKDFLLDSIDMNFNVIIGNPPYVGHKSVDKEYSKLLKENYKGIYKDKGDISYCFFKSALEKLEYKGKLSFITSRYFIESPSGEELRKILLEKTKLYKIVDFYGIRPFKNVGVDPAIIFLINEEIPKNQIDNVEIEVIKPMTSTGKNKKDFYEALFINEDNNYKKFYVLSKNLDNKGWILVDEKQRNIIKKIEEKSPFLLEDICDSYQGIITGCDKAFVVDYSTIIQENIERDIIKPWIKSSYIYKGQVLGESKFVIYSDLIDNEQKYPNAINYIINYREKLMNRRECKKGLRKWYELQWGRNGGIFEKEKIIFPYKSSTNRFALDKGSYFSADVYSLVLKEHTVFSYDYLLYLLNSKLYEFYFKTFGKKLGENLFEYYPNKLMKLSIPYIADYNSQMDESYLYKFFELSKDEINIVEG
ncbi:Eco57I restriction-modification methylase domain-containing protein [Clostridium magnum]|uniref:site-specific DNA-methyltransferase (adenine-specific) n=1 Tax=Clostridium magnum DSM 2767 TaxID=1121326 RepID=A0A161YRW3_9CLOT|nr:N-6 DNA methylase [Clostridium magnum]KZL93742.1 modification methylase PaeR7I [Clostridium magnum DSM 2767]SHI09493.1 adenine-specific DNA-methyltransferase [Clostridium magnum DSM 2767]